MQNFLKEKAKNLKTGYKLLLRISKKVLTLQVSTSYIPTKQEFPTDKLIVTCRQTTSYMPRNYKLHAEKLQVASPGVVIIAMYS